MPRWPCAAQKYAVWKKLQAGSQHWLEQQDKLRTAANAKRAKATNKRTRKADGTLASGATTGGSTGPTGKQGKTGAERGQFPRSDAEQLTGITHQQVSKWRNRPHRSPQSRVWRVDHEQRAGSGAGEG